MAIDIEKWAFVDAADGRRWLGEVEKIDGVAVEEMKSKTGLDVSLFERTGVPPSSIQFSRAAEEWPYGSTTVMLPEKALVGGNVKLKNEEIANIAGNFVPPCKRAFLPPWTVYRPAGFCWLKDYPETIREEFRFALESLEKQCAENLRAAKLARETETENKQKGRLQ